VIRVDPRLVGSLEIRVDPRPGIYYRWS